VIRGTAVGEVAVVGDHRLFVNVDPSESIQQMSRVPSRAVVASERTRRAKIVRIVAVVHTPARWVLS
jgi:hypothetical protein